MSDKSRRRDIIIAKVAIAEYGAPDAQLSVSNLVKLQAAER
jgi:hypothetical protein